MSAPDFEALRAKRNAEVMEHMQRLADEMGVPLSKCHMHFDPDACYCACPDGPCEHKWDGPDWESESMCSVTCSRCGCTAMSPRHAGDAMSACTKRDCVGCRDDFYNHRTGFDGATQCWSLESATKVKARDVPIDLRPPYLHIPLTTRPNCYRAQGYVRVLPERLDSKGFWK